MPISSPGLAVAAAKTATFLIGVAAALGIAGIVHSLAATTVFAVPPQSHVAAGALIALGVGARVPQRVAIWLCLAVLRRMMRRRGNGEVVSPPFIFEETVDRSLHWVALSVVCVAAGLAIASAGWFVAGGIGCRQWVEVHFLLSDPFWPMVFVLLGFGVGLIPLAPLGLAMAMAHRLSSRDGTWDHAASGWSLIGASAGTLIAGWIGQASSGAGLYLLAGALPPMLIALVAVVCSCLDNRSLQVPDQTAALPQYADWRSDRLRGVVWVMGVLLAVVGTAWLAEYADHGLRFGAGLAPMLLAIGGGMLAGAQGTENAPGSLWSLGWGMALLSMLLLAGSACVLGDWLPWPTGTALTASVCLVGLGYGLACGLGHLLLRAARRFSAGAHGIARLLVVCALAGPFATSLLSMFLDPGIVLALAAIALAVTSFLLIFAETPERFLISAWMLRNFNRAVRKMRILQR